MRRPTSARHDSEPLLSLTPSSRATAALLVPRDTSASIATRASRSSRVILLSAHFGTETDPTLRRHPSIYTSPYGQHEPSRYTRRATDKSPQDAEANHV